MSLFIDQFHFLRPAWLLVIPASLLIIFLDICEIMYETNEGKKKGE